MERPSAFGRRFRVASASGVEFARSGNGRNATQYESTSLDACDCGGRCGLSRINANCPLARPLRSER